MEHHRFSLKGAAWMRWLVAKADPARKYLPTPESQLWSLLRTRSDLTSSAPRHFDTAYRCDGMGWLHWAVWNRCDASVFSWLLSHGVKASDVNTLGLTALEEALSRGQVEAVEALWSAAPSPRWAWALYLSAAPACAPARHRALQALLQLNPPLHHPHQESALFWAALRKDAEGWGLLVKAGAPLDKATYSVLEAPGTDPLWRRLALEHAWSSSLKCASAAVRL